MAQKSLRPFCVNIIMLLKKSLTYQKGITLVELLIAVTLLGLIAAAGTAIDFTSRMALIRGTKRVDVRGRASFAMEHMVRHIRFANKVSPTSGTGLTTIDLWRDDDNTPGDITDDTQLTYDLSGNQILFSDTDDGITDEVIADGATGSFDIYNNPPKVKISITVTSGAESVSLESTVSLWCKGNT